jgi:hypothetical protein
VNCCPRRSPVSARRVSMAAVVVRSWLRRVQQGHGEPSEHSAEQEARCPPGRVLAARQRPAPGCHYAIDWCWLTGAGTLLAGVACVWLAAVSEGR